MKGISSGPPRTKVSHATGQIYQMGFCWSFGLHGSGLWLRTCTIGTFRIALHNFVFGLSICETNNFSSDFTEHFLANYFAKFLHSFHNFRRDPVVCSGVAVSYKNQQDARRKIHNDFSQIIFISRKICLGIKLWKVLCGVHFSFHRKMFGELMNSEIQGVSMISLSAAMYRVYITDVILELSAGRRSIRPVPKTKQKKWFWTVRPLN